VPELEFQRYVFEIAIYAYRHTHFLERRQKQLDEHLSWLTHVSGEVTRNEAPTVFTNAEHYFITKYGGWRYTQIIGWLRLYILGTQVRGEAWFVQAKRITRTMKYRKFRHFGKAFELEFGFEDLSSIDIYNQILVELENLTKVKPYKGRYIDLEAFRNIAPFVNWRQIIGLE
jgi:hypothetical protein